MTTNYDIKKDEKGKDLCRFMFEWVDKNGETQTVETNCIETAQTVIGLLSGEICLADLEQQ